MARGDIAPVMDLLADEYTHLEQKKSALTQAFKSARKVRTSLDDLWVSLDVLRSLGFSRKELEGALGLPEGLVLVLDRERRNEQAPPSVVTDAGEVTFVTEI